MPGVIGNLQGTDNNNYDKLVSALDNRSFPVNQTELYRATKLKSSKTIPELGESIRRLTWHTCRYLRQYQSLWQNTISLTMNLASQKDRIFPMR